MSVAAWVGTQSWSLGTADFVNSFFSTIAVRAEGGLWGSRFPIVMNELYAGRLPSKLAAGARSDLRDIRDALSALPPTDVVWDLDDRSKVPPWGDDISPDIDSLASYFWTNDGQPLIDVLDSALASSASSGEDLRIE
jgi:hypothetical protein